MEAKSAPKSKNRKRRPGRQLGSGIIENQYASGRLRSRGTLVRGKLHGVYEEFFETRVRSLCCTYKNGERDGLCEEWDYAGSLIARVMYVSGQKDGLLEEWRNGKPPEGRLEEWRNGKLTQQNNYKMGKLHGKSTLWDGDITFISHYYEGTREGQVGHTDLETNEVILDSLVTVTQDGKEVEKKNGMCQHINLVPMSHVASYWALDNNIGKAEYDTRLVAAGIIIADAADVPNPLGQIISGYAEALALPGDISQPGRLRDT